MPRLRRAAEAKAEAPECAARKAAAGKLSPPPPPSPPCRVDYGMHPIAVTITGSDHTPGQHGDTCHDDQQTPIPPNETHHNVPLSLDPVAVINHEDPVPHAVMPTASQRCLFIC